MKIRVKFFYIVFILFSCLINGVASSDSGIIEVWTDSQQAGSPIEGANVILLDSSESEVGINTVRTSPDGHYIAVPNGPGPKYLLVWAPGFSPEREIVNVNSENQRIDFTLSTAGRIIGTISDISNRPIKGAHVNVEYFQRRDFPLVAQTLSGVLTSKQNGFFLIRNIEHARAIRVSVTHPDFEPYFSSPITLEPGQHITLNIILIR
jgi:hypothetical protein